MNVRPRQLGLTPGRAALVAVLGVALLAVWGPQLVRLASPATTPPRAARPAVVNREVPASTTAANPAEATGGRPVQSDRPMPKFALTEAGAYDPFAAPAWSTASAGTATGVAAAGEAPSADAMGERFAALRDKGVAMIYVSAAGKAAQVGDQTLHVGDRIDGFEVVEITPAGVVFRPAPADEAEEGSHGA